MTSKLLSHAVITAQPADKECLLWDTKITGFGYCQRWSKKRGMFLRRYYLQYKSKCGKQRKITLDANKVSFSQAKEKADEIFAQVTLGHDPVALDEARLAEQARPTFGIAVARYLEAKQAKFRPASHREATRYLSGRQYFPSLHGLLLHTITPQQINACLTEIGTNCGTSAAGRARSITGSFFEWCMSQALVLSNPISLTERPQDSAPRERVLTDSELKRVWDACGDNSEYSKIIRLIVLTGLRRQEIGGLRWSEFNDLDAGIVTIPSARSKNRRSHTVTLSPMALAIILSVKRREGHDNLFGASGFVNWGHSKAALDDRLGEMEPWIIHDIRRTAATRMCDLGIPMHVVDGVLNHVKKSKTQKSYFHSTFDKERADALVKWSNRVAVITGDNVVALPRKRAS
jgi:integrase